MRAILLTALLASSPAAADTAAVVADHARPGFAAFDDAVARLADVESCDPEALRPAFQTAYDAWMAVEHLHLGPAEENGRALSILFWPDPKGLGAKAQTKLLTGDQGSLSVEAMAEQSVAARGLAGLERLLYPAKPLAADPCPLIQVTIDDLARQAEVLSAEWGPFGDQLLSAGQAGNTRYLKPEEATQALFTQLATGLEFVADRRIGRPLATFDKPRPDLAEGQASGRALANITLSLKGLRGLSAALSPESSKTLAAFDHAIALSEGLDDPLLDHITDPQSWLKLEILQQAVRATRDTAIAELGPALGVELGFNSQDGD
ncbi:MAG: imelysin family protein [Rhodobacterales bacterium]|nr:imelysin family protein [Rhodobacterales bacterium]